MIHAVAELNFSPRLWSSVKRHEATNDVGPCCRPSTRAGDGSGPRFESALTARVRYHALHESRSRRGRSARAEGVEYTFGVVGSTTNTIVTEMYGRNDIRFVDTRHEEGAAFMAYGYARVLGKPTACITTSGPGTTNLVTGIALAAKGRAPVLAIAGDVARDYIYRDGSQAFDLVGLFKPITKLSLEVNLTARIPEMLHYAFRAMLSDKRGPAFLDIPRDLLDNQTIEGTSSGPRPIAPWMRASRVMPRRSSARSRCSRRRSGRCCSWAGASSTRRRARKRWHSPSCWTWRSSPRTGTPTRCPTATPFTGSPPGGRGAGEAAEALHRADVILALGTRLNQATTLWNYRVINRETRIIQVDIDAQEIGRNYPVAVGTPATRAPSPSSSSMRCARRGRSRPGATRSPCSPRAASNASRRSSRSPAIR